MPKAKGLAQIASRLGVRRDTARDILKRKPFPVRRRGETHVVGTKYLDDYRHERQAVPAWENEGGACPPIYERKIDDPEA